MKRRYEPANDSNIDMRQEKSLLALNSAIFCYIPTTMALVEWKQKDFVKSKDLSIIVNFHPANDCNNVVRHNKIFQKKLLPTENSIFYYVLSMTAMLTEKRGNLWIAGSGVLPTSDCLYSEDTHQIIPVLWGKKNLCLLWILSYSATVYLNNDSNAWSWMKKERIFE